MKFFSKLGFSVLQQSLVLRIACPFWIHRAGHCCDRSSKGAALDPVLCAFRQHVFQDFILPLEPNYVQIIMLLFKGSRQKTGRLLVETSTEKTHFLEEFMQSGGCLNWRNDGGIRFHVGVRIYGFSYAMAVYESVCQYRLFRGPSKREQKAAGLVIVEVRTEKGRNAFRADSVKQAESNMKGISEVFQCWIALVERKILPCVQSAVGLLAVTSRSALSDQNQIGFGSIEESISPKPRHEAAI